MEFGCGDEDGCDLLQMNVDIVFVQPELPSHCTALSTRPAPRAPAGTEAPECTDPAPRKPGDAGAGGGEAVFVQLCYCVKQNTAKALTCRCVGVLAGAGCFWHHSFTPSCSFRVVPQHSRS